MSTHEYNDASFEASEAQFRRLLRERSMSQAEKTIAETEMVSRDLDEALTQQHKPIAEHQFQFGDVQEQSAQQPDAARGDSSGDEGDEGDAGDGGAGPDSTPGQLPGPNLPFEMPGEEAGSGEDGEGQQPGFGTPAPGEAGEGDEGSDSGDEEGDGAGQGAGELLFEDNPTIGDYLEHELEKINLKLEDLGVGLITRREYIDIRGRMEEGPMSLLDLRATELERRKRWIARGRPAPETVRFTSRDFQFHRPHLGEEPVTRVVLFLVMDTSGSMNQLRKYLARLAGMVAVLLLRRQYDVVDIRFIVHDAQAHEVEEGQWFSKAPSGGTLISSGFAKSWEIYNAEYRDGWNAYLQFFTDGDNTTADNDEVERLLREMLPHFNLVSILRTQGTSKDLHGIVKRLNEEFDNFAYERVEKEKAELGPALRAIWEKDQRRKSKPRRGLR